MWTEEGGGRTHSTDAGGCERCSEMQEAAAAGYGLSQWGVVYRAMQGRVSEQH
jgi:hypothetical protein